MLSAWTSTVQTACSTRVLSLRGDERDVEAVLMRDRLERSRRRWRPHQKGCLADAARSSRAPRQHERSQWGSRDHSRGAPHVGDKRDFTRPIASCEIAELAPASRHSRGAVDEDEELASELAFPHQRLATGKVDQVGKIRDSPELVLRTSGEKRHPGDQLDLRVLADSHETIVNEPRGIGTPARRGSLCLYFKRASRRRRQFGSTAHGRVGWCLTHQ